MNCRNLWKIALAAGLVAAVSVAVATPARAQGLDFNQVLFDGVGGVDGLGGPRIVELSPDGRHVYVVSERDGAVAVFERDAQTGSVSFVQAVFDGVDGVVGLRRAVGIEVSPDGRHVYVTTAPSAVVVFERDAATGELAFVEAELNGVDGVSGIGFAVWAQVSPDGKHLYVAGVAEDAIAVFERDAETGEITWVSKVQDGVGGVDSINAVFPLAMSHDGAQLYSGALVDNALTVFSRDPQTGALTPQQVLVNGVGGVEGIAGPREVKVSADGRHVYVAGLFGHSVGVFARHPGSGELSFVEAHFDDQGGIQNLLGAVSVAPSSDGRRVYAASFDEDAIVIFDRDPASGRLTFVGEVVDGQGGVTGLDSVISLASSADGRNLYAVSFFASSLAVFDVDH